jgi:rSAM/selenodomain-associated transferase 2
MTAPVTIIIPTLNAVETIGPTLATAYVGVGQGLVHEVIFADGGSDDAIAEVAKDTGATLINSSKGRGTQLAKGAAAATTPWLLFLHADTMLDENWPDAVRDHLNSGAEVGYFKLAFDDTGFATRLVAGWANVRSRLFGLPYGDQGLLISRRSYQQAGGFDDIPLMEDVALIRRLPRAHSLGATATTSFDRYRRDGWIKRGLRNLVTLGLYFAGTSPQQLAKRYN